MPQANDTAEIIRQNLIDAGCDKATSDKCMAFADNGAFHKMLPMLAQQRKSILDDVHCKQRQLYCLDYLVHQIQNNKFREE